MLSLTFFEIPESVGYVITVTLLAVAIALGLIGLLEQFFEKRSRRRWPVERNLRLGRRSGLFFRTYRKVLPFIGLLSACGALVSFLLTSRASDLKSKADAERILGLEDSYEEARLENRAEKARLDSARADAVAAAEAARLERAKAQREAETARLAALQAKKELQDTKRVAQSIRWKPLTPTQQERLHAILSGAGPGVIILQNMAMPDAKRLADQFEATFKQLGWQVKRHSLFAQFPPPEGFYLAVHSRSKLPPYIGELNRALIELGLKSQTDLVGQHPGEIPPQQALMRFGYPR